jgi:oxygen-dependent protoporphyrinogen oxidase
VEVLADAIGEERIMRHTPVGSIRAGSSALELEVPGEPVRADAVVLATPAFASAELLSGDAATVLGEIPYASTAVVLLVYPEGSDDRLPDGTGFVVPQGESEITACTWISRKWPRPEFGSGAVIRCYLGRAGAEAVLEEADGALIDRAAGAIDGVLELGRPEDARVVRWERAMPQYEVGHLDRVRRVRESLPAGIFVTGSAYGGVGIADCVRQAGETARDVHGYLESRRTERETVPWTN